MEQTILECEERLRQAQLSSDVAALDQLISDDLQFVFHDGAVCTKQMDLGAHRAGIYKFKYIEFSEQRITCLGDVAVATTRAKLAGTASNEPFEAEMRYLRVWMNRGGNWQIVAGSVSQMPK